MEKMNELSKLLKDLIICGNTLTKTAQALKDFYSSPYEEAPAKPDPELKKKENANAEALKAKNYTKEDVRGILAKKANEAEGKYKADVKAIVKKYGNGGNLTNINEKYYAALVSEIEGLTYE